MIVSLRRWWVRRRRAKAWKHYRNALVVQRYEVENDMPAKAVFRPPYPDPR